MRAKKTRKYCQRKSQTETFELRGSLRKRWKNSRKGGILAWPRTRYLKKNILPCRCKKKRGNTKTKQTCRYTKVYMYSHHHHFTILEKEKKKQFTEMKKTLSATTKTTRHGCKTMVKKVQIFYEAVNRFYKHYANAKSSKLLRKKVRIKKNKTKFIIRLLIIVCVPVGYCCFVTGNQKLLLHINLLLAASPQ